MARLCGVCSKRRWIAFKLYFVYTVGVMLCMYAMHIGKSKKEDGTYEAFCDLGDNAKCSEALISDFSVGFGGLMEILLARENILVQPNSVVGLFVYTLLLFLTGLDEEVMVRAHYYISCLGIAATLYLALTLLYMRNFCIVCVATYFVNIITHDAITTKYKMRFDPCTCPRQR